MLTLDDSRDRSYCSVLVERSMDILTASRICKIPLLNWLIILAHFIMLEYASLWFQTVYDVSPWAITAMVNLLLYGLADTIAQTIRSVAVVTFEAELKASDHNGDWGHFYRYIFDRGRPRRILLDDQDDDLVELGLARLPPTLTPNNTHIKPQNPEIFNFQRLLLFSAWGPIISCVQSPWYKFLNGGFAENHAFVSIIRRVLADQLFYSPISLACFLSYICVILERGDASAVKQKLMDLYVPTLATNYTVWPFAQVINFLCVPANLQIPFSSTISVLWNIYLSLKNPT